MLLAATIAKRAITSKECFQKKKLETQYKVLINHLGIARTLK